jgi:hypothetical protein
VVPAAGELSSASAPASTSATTREAGVSATTSDDESTSRYAAPGFGVPAPERSTYAAVADDRGAEDPPVAQRAAEQTPSVQIALALPPDSDLVMVETRHAAPPVEVEEPVPARPRRERRTHTVVPAEPLQLVETRKEQPSG